MSKKFCVLPGRETVRIAKTDGRVILIGEELTEIPEDLHGDAYALGAIDEDQLKSLKKSFGAKEKTETPAAGAVPPVPPAPPANAERQDKIVAATKAIIDGADPTQVTTAGKPKLEFIEAIVGFSITAAERDAAFDALAKE